MKGKLIRVNNEWMVSFFDGYSAKTVPLHPSEKTNSHITLNEGSEVEFDLHDEPYTSNDRFARLYVQHNF